MKPIVLVFAFTLLMAVPALAGEPVACGVTDPASLNTDIPDYCNFHDRRFAYRDEDKKFKSLIDERRANFNAPRAEALKAYKGNLEAYYKEMDKQDIAKEDSGDQEISEGNIGNQ